MKIAFYKSTLPGITGNYNRLIRWWTRSPYSHAEIIFEDGMAASSSFVDGGVRFKKIEFDATHWDTIEISADETKVHKWFMDHIGCKYDLLGVLGFVLGFIPQDNSKYSCAESIASALGYIDPWRFSPAMLYVLAIDLSNRLK